MLSWPPHRSQRVIVPIADVSRRRAESSRLAEAIRITAEPGEWCFTGSGGLAERLDASADGGEPLDGPALVEVRGWLDAGAATRDAWQADGLRARYAELAAVAAGIPIVCAVSAPSSMAVDLARRFDQTLIGFLRGSRFNIYISAKRIDLATP